MIGFMVIKGEWEKEVVITETFEDKVTFVFGPWNEGSIRITFNINMSSRILVDQIINSSLEGCQRIYEVGFSARSWEINVNVG